jgi:hypothetical protein
MVSVAMSKKALKLNVTAALARLGGVPSVVVGLKEVGAPVHPDTPHQWCARGIVPMGRWLSLMEVARRRAVPFAIDDFVS